VKLVITLIGGPLDGIYIPVKPEMPGVPTQLYIYADEAGAWSLYANDEASPETPAVDVYSLCRGAVNLMAHKPRDAELYHLDYVRPLTAPEVAEIRKIGRNHGL
jgi:hypothetical protein